MAQQNDFPDLVYQHGHRPGLEPPKTFEDSLRDLIRSSPYLVISFVVHAVLLILFAQAPVEVSKDEAKTIIATPDVIEEPPPPEPEEPPPEVEQVEEIIEDPTISDTDVVDTVDDYDLLPSGDVDTGANDVIGIGGGGLAGGRGGGGKTGGRGGGGRYNEAVEDALKWLANHQSPEGYWACEGFDLECGKQGQDTVCDGRGSPMYDVGVSSLALLAFLGADNTPQRGNHREVVSLGLRFLRDIQQPDGNFGDERKAQYTYDHALATLAMIEAYQLTNRDRRFKGPAEKGLAYMYKIRNPAGAWRYAPFERTMSDKANDMSVTGWMIMVMTSARDAGLHVDEGAWEDTWTFLEEMTDTTTGVTGYFDRGGRPPREEGKEALWPSGQTESMTAVGVMCRFFMDPDLERPGNEAMINKGVSVISRLPPVWSDDQPGRRDFYFWYYGSYALFQNGGEPWKAWERALKPAIVDNQHREGERKGSWDPQVDPWGTQGGRVYATAINALTLEVFYRYTSVIGRR